MLGREGREGAVEEVVVVAGLTAEGEVVVVMAVEAAGLPAVGREDNADPAHRSRISIRGKSEMRRKMGWVAAMTLWGSVHRSTVVLGTRGRLTTSSCSLPGFGRRDRRHNRNQPCIGTSTGKRGKMMDLGLYLGLGLGGGENRVEVDRWIWGIWGGEEGKSRDLQVACGRQWRSRGCRRLPMGKVDYGKDTKDESSKYKSPSALRLWTRVTSSRPEA